jgi:hypothetical protein
MRRVTAFDHVTLDGVMQAPGRADEDCREDFRHGGWSPPYGDEVMFESGGTYAALRLVDAKPTTTGVIIATYATS